MSEVKGQAIKLFGIEILLHPEKGFSTSPINHRCCAAAADRHNCCSSKEYAQSSGGESTETKTEDGCNPVREEPIDLASSESNQEQETSAMEEATSSAEATTRKEDPAETSTSQDKVHRKPDEVIPCPRCNSKETKFCYFNNYNANQPRHFCKNCQRYWTAGGVMRNVPVGSGRRKNKTTSFPNPKQNGTRHSFLYQSMASKLNVAQGCERIHEPERRRQPAACERIENNVNGSDLNAPRMLYCPWIHSWSSDQWIPSSFGGASFSMSFHPMPPNWFCNIPRSSNVPDQSGLSLGLSSPRLGKHSRDGGVAKPSDSGEGKHSDEELEGHVTVPKTSRINDSDEAEKGRKSKVDETKCVSETSVVLQANPAAYSRSLNFSEST